MKAELTDSMDGQIDRHKHKNRAQMDIEACKHRWKDGIGFNEGREME